MILTKRLFDNALADWDRAFFNEDYSYWRKGNSIKGKELEDSYEYYVPLAGFKKEDVKATIDSGQVYLRAENKKNTADHSFLLPEDVDLKNMSAEHKDGLLTIKLNKKEEAKAIKINIK